VLLHAKWRLTIVRFMPAAVIAAPLTAMMSDPTSQDYQTAVNAVNAAANVHDAVVRSGVLGPHPDVVTETRAVLSALPPAIDQAIMVALKSAMARSLPVRVTWIEDAKIAVRIWEQSQDGGDVLDIVFMSPHGSTF